MTALEHRLAAIARHVRRDIQGYKIADLENELAAMDKAERNYLHNLSNRQIANLIYVRHNQAAILARHHSAAQETNP